jgi:hypothetical protein
MDHMGAFRLDLKAFCTIALPNSACPERQDSVTTIDLVIFGNVGHNRQMHRPHSI